ncbi:hypothetical protein [uncultured Campylobacter sp.]|uniref:hypothetical protein n=1 Tax=uncultured Campylobacter sp. TaxID=218934 RepID=UPI00261B868A|nr:hypothetical protein [uncultured Campylobacter sp.]
MSKGSKMINKDEMIEDLQYELNVVLEAMFLLAGAKRQKLDDLVQAYIECIDDVLKDSKEYGTDEVLKVLNYLKENKKELFS